MTKYLDDHPGGEEVLLDRGGKDATEDYEDVGHSAEARKHLDKFEIGELPPSQKNGEREGGGGGGMTLMVPLMVPLLAVALGVGYYFYAQRMQ